jgi:hypothetical protein
MNNEIKKLFFEVKDAEAEVRNAKQKFQEKEENLTRFLVEQKAWHFLKPCYSRIVFEISH